MIGSHDSMTYLPVKQWYYKPFKWMAKCQSKNLEEQFVDYGVRLFDFRVRFDGTEPVMAHGPIVFKGDIRDYLEYLDLSAELGCENVYVRLLLESNKPMKDQETQELLFQEFCEYCIHKYPNLTFFGGRRKYDWKIIYEFKDDPQLNDLYSSTTNIFGLSKDHWTAKIDDLWPWLYAKLHNKKNYNKCNDAGILFIDFVNIR